jgi:signal peptidase II
VTAALILIADQVSKHLVRTSLTEGQSWDIAPWLAPIVRVTYVTNTGVAFGMFQGLGKLGILVAVVVIVLILYYYRQLPEGQWLMRAVLGLALGGACGNLIDRLRFDGTVLDFIDFNFWPFQNFPVSNIADVSIVSGVSLMMLMLLWEDRQERLRLQAEEGE